MTREDQTGVDLLAVRGMRGILDSYAANPFRRTDRAYISGWTVACAAYDQLLAHLAEQRCVRLPQALPVQGSWLDEERLRNEAALADMGMPVRLPGPESPPLPKPLRWRRERLAVHVVAAGTLLANVAAGCLQEDVLTVFHRLADYERPDLTTGRLSVDWHPTAYDLDELVDQMEFTVKTAHRGDTQVTSGLLRPGWTGISWDLVHGGAEVLHIRVHPATRRRGIGRQLMDALECERERGVQQNPPGA